MKLGLSIGYSGAELELPVDRVLQAERLGFDSVWTAEAYGSDAVTPLAYLAAKTERIRLGTGIMQLAGRTPAMAAMQAQTVDALAGGHRFILGLGRLRPADRGGLVRPAVGRAVLPAAGLHADHPQDLPARGPGLP